MPQLDRPMTRVCVRLWAEDCEELQRLAATNGNLTFNLVLRQIVHSYVTQMRAKVRRNLDKLPTAPPVEIEIEDLQDAG